MPSEEIRQAIEENAKGPKQVSSDGTSVQQHSIDDQIKADRHLAQQDAAKKPRRGLRFTKLISPGSV